MCLLLDTLGIINPFIKCLCVLCSKIILIPSYDAQPVQYMYFNIIMFISLI